jgi:hypothetical protein
MDTARDSKKDYRYSLAEITPADLVFSALQQKSIEESPEAALRSHKDEYMDLLWRIAVAQGSFAEQQTHRRQLSNLLFEFPLLPELLDTPELRVWAAKIYNRSRATFVRASAN